MPFSNQPARRATSNVSSAAPCPAGSRRWRRSYHSRLALGHSTRQLPRVIVSRRTMESSQLSCTYSRPAAPASALSWTSCDHMISAPALMGCGLGPPLERSGSSKLAKL